MYNILVVNAGSSSLKYQLVNMEDKSVVAKGIAERIGIEGSALTYKSAKGKLEYKKPMKDHFEAIKMVLDALVDPENGVVEKMSDIKAVGHRVLHGGATFSGSIVINDEVMKAIEDNIELGPLHNPANLMGIRACQQVMPGTPMVAVFDTAFHQTMPPKAYLYGLPYEDYTELKIRRYGFHGTSHRYVSARAIDLLGNPEHSKVIVCHLGNGSSLSAVVDGKCVDTSMGLTPLEGVIMGTRTGSMDPVIVTRLMEKRGMSIAEVENYINKKSGVLGISGVSSDFRDLEKAADEGNERARLAQEAFAYGVKKYIGAYAAAMGGVDAIAFTAGVGENDAVIRAMVMEGMEFLGADFDFDKNKNFTRGIEQELTREGSKVRVFIIPTDEEMVIATDTFDLTRDLVK